MPITAVTLENFKGIQEPVRIEFRPITLLFGPNSSARTMIQLAMNHARDIIELQSANRPTDTEQ
jgi:hypothetical protein